MKEAIDRSNVDPSAINNVTVGILIPTEKSFAYVPRGKVLFAFSPLVLATRLCKDLVPL